MKFTKLKDGLLNKYSDIFDHLCYRIEINRHNYNIVFPGHLGMWAWSNLHNVINL
jgi:hypothetical protein